MGVVSSTYVGKWEDDANEDNVPRDGSEAMQGNLSLGGYDLDAVGDVGANTFTDRATGESIATVARKGDWVQLTTQTVGDDSNASTANTNWSDVNGGSLSAVRPTENALQTFMPTRGDGTVYIAPACAYNEGSDAIDFRLYDEANATEIGQWNNLTGGWTGFNPTPVAYTWANAMDLELQFRNNDGATTVYATKSVTFRFFTKVQ